MQLYETAIVIVIASIAYDKEATGEVLEDGGCAADKSPTDLGFHSLQRYSNDENNPFKTCSVK
ncbi:hypothetical protein QSH57_009521 [Fusarium oxysporum f. sp. vasinfectum]|nr:hypothetical protein QSH57_009521 [Fusarium oxysporum f. sp. vasinfectum]